MNAEPDILAWLRLMVERKASDLHLSAQSHAYLRIDGSMLPLRDRPPLSADDVKRLLNAILPAENLAEFERAQDTDFAYAVPELGRFRVNVFADQRGHGAVVRLIPNEIPTLEALGMPPILRDLCALQKGLVLVTGPTGSGKTTTLAAMIDHINRTQPAHIITIEDPVEFHYPSHMSLINQREVRSNTRGFAQALRAALREDPDIVMIGEMRDLETIEVALETAETGHLVMGTLHTSTAPETVDRLVSKFPGERQNQIRTMLADTLKAVVAQTLCRRRDGGRVAALEILTATTTLSSLIRDGKMHQIESVMQTGRKYGMQVLNDELFRLAREGVIEPEEAYVRSSDRTDMRQRLAVLARGEAAPAPGAAKAGSGTRAPAVPRAEGGPAAVPRGGKDVERLRAALAETPHSPVAMNNLAWALATHERPDLRDAEEALALARQARELAGEDPRILDTLAAALFEVGQREGAVETAVQGLNMARAMDESAVAASIEQRLAVYRAALAPDAAATPSAGTAFPAGS